MSPAVSEVVPTNPLDPDPEKLLEDRRAWASLAEEDLIYIRVRSSDVEREELYDLREDALQSSNLVNEPARQPDLQRLRKSRPAHRGATYPPAVPAIEPETTMEIL